MADPHGFLEVAKVEAAKRPVDERVGDWREVYERQDPQERSFEVSQQARRCMDCGIPFCHSGTAGCPLGNLIPEWNDLVRRGRWDAASDRLHATNNFPEFTGRLCPAPCESACVLSIDDEKTGGSVTIKRIEQTIADHAWMTGSIEPQPAAISTGKSVAVVGSGPAGLAAAQQLTRAGHHVTVYERDDRLGGLMRYGIPEYKLEKAMVNQRLAQMRAEGTRFVTECEVGVDLSVDQLRDRHDAVVLAVGALRGRDSDVEGRASRRCAPCDGASRARQPGMRGRRPVAAFGQGQARRHHRRRRHRRGLPRYRAPPGCRVGHATRLQPRAAGDTATSPARRGRRGRWCCARRLRTPRAVRAATRSRCSGSSATTTDACARWRSPKCGSPATPTAGGSITPVGESLEIPCDLALLAIGFDGVEHMALLDGLGLELNGRGCVVMRFGLADGGARGVRLWRCSSWGVTDRLGDRRRAQRSARGRRVLDGRIRPTGTRVARRAAAGRRVMDTDRDYAEKS